MVLIDNSLRFSGIPNLQEYFGPWNLHLSRTTQGKTEKKPKDTKEETKGKKKGKKKKKKKRGYTSIPGYLLFRVGLFARIGLSRFVSSLAFPNSRFAARAIFLSLSCSPLQAPA